jgi:hypothetical protein
MDLTTITVPEDVAEERVREYEVAVRERRDAEDQAILSAYKAAARGLPIIMLPQVIKAGGFFSDGHPVCPRLPKLAIARADARTCWVDSRSNEIVYRDSNRVQNRGALVAPHSVSVSVPGNRWWRSAQTIVPHVPPRHRPKRGRIGSFHVLWEVEEWTNVAPIDPALLRHIRGDLWSVLAVWDLTDLERAVLSAR